MSKNLFVINPAFYKCGMFFGLINVRHFIVIIGVRYNDPVYGTFHKKVTLTTEKLPHFG